MIIKQELLEEAVLLLILLFILQPATYNGSVKVVQLL